MILPNKYVPITYTYLGIGSAILKILKKQPLHVEELWHRMMRKPEVGSFDRFALTLDLLFMLDLVILYEGKIQRRNP